MGKGHKAKAPILQALGNDGQQRTLAKTGSNPYLPAIHRKAPEAPRASGAFSFWDMQGVEEASKAG